MRSRKERWKKILQIAWPLIVANSFWNIQLTIDRMYLGNFSTEALGAAMAVMGVFWTPMALLQQTAAYVATFVAQYLGAKETKMIGPSVWQSIYISVVGGILFLALIFFSEDFFSFVGHSSAIQKLEVEYFDAICLSALPMALVAACSGYYTGLTKTKMVIWINAVGLVVNVLFDYLLIFGKWGFPAWGMKGAGWATALASWAGAIFGFYMIFGHQRLKEYKLWSGWRWHPELFYRFIKFGVPSGLQWALEGLAFTVFLIIIGRFPNGEAALASTSIVITVMMLSVLPTFGIAQAVMALVGQYLGEKKPEKAEAYSWSGVQVAFFYIAAMSLTFVLFPQFYLSWFENKSNPVLWNEVSTIVPTLLLFMALFTTFDSVNLTLSFALKGAGDTRFVFLAALFLPWPLMVLPTYLFRNAENALYLSWSAASFYIFILSLTIALRFRGGKWKSMSVIH